MIIINFCCNFVPQSFKLIAQTLGECIVSQPDVRTDVLSALRKVLLQCLAGKCLCFIIKVKLTNWKQ